MGKTTEYLGLYEPYDSDFYDVDRDQNENFTILDNKAKEVDEAILSAKGYTDGLATSKTINSFPLSRATEGEVYRVPTTNKYVVCTKNYNGSLISLPNANFEELSAWRNKKNIEKLDILHYSNKIVEGKTGKTLQEILFEDLDNGNLHAVYYIKSKTIVDITIERSIELTPLRVDKTYGIFCLLNTPEDAFVAFNWNSSMPLQIFKIN